MMKPTTTVSSDELKEICYIIDNLSNAFSFTKMVTPSFEDITVYDSNGDVCGAITYDGTEFLFDCMDD